MKFTEIPDIISTRTDVPVRIKKIQSYIGTLLSEIVEEVILQYEPTAKFKRSIIDLMNTVFCYILRGDSFQDNWNPKQLITGIELLSPTDYEDELGDLTIRESDIVWDIEYKYDSKSNSNTSDPIKPMSETVLSFSNMNSKQLISNDSLNTKSKKDDITFEFPKYPCLNINKVWAIAKDEADRPIPIYVTLPEIPKKQCEISATTDINNMTTSDLLRLFPSEIIQPRKDDMYFPIPGYEFDEVLGFIPHISGFTKKQIVDNIIRYPQFNYMYRIVDGERISFMKHIEVDGKLISISDALESIKDIQELPHKKLFIWDYIVRRYLLERDIKHIKHKYPLLGSFDPFMTLFMPSCIYAKYGYNNAEEIARNCVSGRVKFYQTRNPLIRRLLDESELS